MTAQTNSKVLFIINPAAGVKSKVNFQDTIQKKGTVSSYNYKNYFIKGVGDIDLIAEEMRVYRPDIVAAVGGDGTCNLVAQLLIHNVCKMGIIPLGSANGMATELAIPKEIDAAIDLLYTGQPKKIDLLLINGTEIAMHLSDVGLNARIIKRFSKENKRGLWRYVRHFFTEYFLTKHYQFLIFCDGNKLIKRKAISITFANASKYGTGAIINPKGVIDDGKFELCIIKPFPWYYLVPITLKFFRGNLNNSKYVEIISCKEAKIICRKSLILQIDGEIKGRVNEVSVKIIPQSITVIVPKQAHL